MPDTKKRAHEAEAEAEAKAASTAPAPAADTQSGATNASDSDSDDMGPMPVPAGAPAKKQRRTLEYEHLYLEQLPNADRYHKSLMHRDTINSVSVTRGTNYLITTSLDGHVKFWKKQAKGIEFVKDYRAHIAAIVATSTSADGLFFASAAADGSVKVFDVANFDLINMIQLKYTPRAACWVHERGSADPVLAISDEESPAIRLYNGRGDAEPIETVDKMHRQPCHVLAYNAVYNCVVSADIGGMIEYWMPHAPHGLPRGVFQLKSSTDLFEYKKARSTPLTLTFSDDFEHFVATAADRQVRVFQFARGKLVRKYDESLAAIQEMQQAGTASYQVEDMEFGRRLAVERDIDATMAHGPQDARGNASGGATANAIFDRSGKFIIYATILGIKIVNLVTNHVRLVLGKDESTRFMHVALYQGAPERKMTTSLALAASNNPVVDQAPQVDPMIFCTGFKRSRFYMFARYGPESDPTSKITGNDRDVFNERPTREDQAVATAAAPERPRQTATTAVLHTTMGDIHLRLFPQHVPITVENFAGLSRKGYYNGVIFHRVIRKFMIQTGDPLGDGTGGESLWGKEFQDEFHTELRHDRPYTVSMANAGPNTNGSQFFITTVPTPWLDKKHTVFGRVTAGIDVVHQIENVVVNRRDKPLCVFLLTSDDIRIFSVSVQ